MNIKTIPLFIGYFLLTHCIALFGFCTLLVFGTFGFQPKYLFAMVIEIFTVWFVYLTSSHEILIFFTKDTAYVCVYIFTIFLISCWLVRRHYAKGDKNSSNNGELK